MKPQVSTDDVKRMAWALEHCLSYMTHKQLKDCGLFDDRDCSPYHDAEEALRIYLLKGGAK